MQEYLLGDDKLLIRKAEDKMNICEKRGMISCTGFLNEREQGVLEQAIRPYSGIRMLFYGGYDDAQRRMLVFLPEYFELEDDQPLSAVRASYYKEYELSHRDFLGSLTGAGISRDAVGDILVDKDAHTADIIIKNDIKDFVLSEIKNAGRAALDIKEISLSSLHIPIEKTEVFSDTVASPRLDAVASAGFGISRENASSLIRSGKVFVNRVICQAPDKAVPDGAVINAAGYGKFRVYITGSISKKGRMFLKIEKFI